MENSMHRLVLISSVLLSIFNLSSMEQSAQEKLSLVERLPKDMHIECLKLVVRPHVHQAIVKTKTYDEFKKVTTGATVAYIPCANTCQYFYKLIKEKITPAILAEQETKNIIEDHYYDILMNYLEGKGLIIKFPLYVCNSYQEYKCEIKLPSGIIITFPYEKLKKTNKDIFNDPAFSSRYNIGAFLAQVHLEHRDEASLDFLCFIFKKIYSVDPLNSYNFAQ